MATGAEALVRALQRAGATCAFGVGGPHNLGLIAELHAQGVRFVAVHDPAAAVQAAAGHSGRTGRFGVAITGPRGSALGVLQALSDARAAGAPVLLLDPAPSAAFTPRRPIDAVEVVPPDAALTGVAVEVLSLSTGEDVAAVVARARDAARRPPGGPVVVHVPVGFAADAVPEPDEAEAASDTPAKEPAAPVEHVQLRRAANLVDASQNVLIWVGGGAMRAGAGGAIAELAEKVGAPVITTVHAAGILPARHPCLVGMPPHLPAVGALWDDADLVVGIGTDFDADATQGGAQPPPAALIAINVDPVDAGRNYRPDVLLRGDARTLTKALADTVSYRGGTAVVRSRLNEVRTTVRRQLETAHATETTFVASVSAALPDRTTVVADPCAAGRWLAAFHEWTLPRTLLYPPDDDSVGSALPTAIGAASAASTEPVVAVVGDQGLLAQLGALAVIAREALPLTLLVVDDGGAGGLRPLLDAMDLPPDLLDRASPDLAATARALGLRSDTVESVDEALTTALQAHIAAPDPTVLVVKARLSPPPTVRHRWYRQPSRTL